VTSRHPSETAKIPEIMFRALLAEGVQEVRFERVGG
jgi:hypothetical protein